MRTWIRGGGRAGAPLHALVDRAALETGETLLVHGVAGGVGTAAIELGKLIGARVIAAASTDEKLAYSKERGADGGINYKRDDLKERAKAGMTRLHGAVATDPV